MRLIDADTLIQEIKRWKEREIADGLIGKGIKAGYDAAMICVSEMPTIEERKHGHWIQVSDWDKEGNAHFDCSVCGFGDKHVEDVVVPYCWHCGARMDEEAKQ